MLTTDKPATDYHVHHLLYLVSWSNCMLPEIMMWPPTPSRNLDCMKLTALPCQQISGRLQSTMRTGICGTETSFYGLKKLCPLPHPDWVDEIPPWHQLAWSSDLALWALIPPPAYLGEECHVSKLLLHIQDSLSPYSISLEDLAPIHCAMQLC